MRGFAATDAFMLNEHATPPPSTNSWNGLRRCFSTLGCAELSLEKIGGICTRLGLDEIELRGIDDTLNLPTWFAERFGTPAALREAAKEWPFRVGIIDTSFALIGKDAAARAEVEAFAPWADALEVPWLRVFDGGKFKMQDPERAFDEAAETMAWWRETKKSHGWHTDFVIETHDLLCSSENCLRLEERLPAPVALLWDSWHIWFHNQENLEETWAALAPFVRHIHFKDGIREAKGNHPYTYVLPGKGVFPLEDLFTMLKAAHYPGAVSLEWERKWHPYLPPVEEALECLR